MSLRVLAAWAMAVVVAVGPLQPLAQAQDAGAPAATPGHDGAPRRPDAYDVAAGVVTVARAPFNAVLCVLGTGLAAALFVITFGSAYKASARVVEEGCGGPWVVRGDDLRPDAARLDPAPGS